LSISTTKDCIVLCNQYQPFWSHTSSIKKTSIFVIFVYLINTTKHIYRNAVVCWNKGVKQFIMFQTRQRIGLPKLLKKMRLYTMGLTWKCSSPQKICFRLINGISPKIAKLSRTWETGQRERTGNKSFGILLKNNSSARLLIAGKPVLQGEYQNSLEQLSKNLGIQECVKFLGHVTNTTSVYKSVRYLFCPVCGRNHLEEQLLNQWHAVLR